MPTMVHIRLFATFCITTFLSWAAFALPAIPEPILRDEADLSCTFGPNSRGCWTSGYSIESDVDNDFPSTGDTVTYDLVVTNSTCSPDGGPEKVCFRVNDQYPGPTIRAKWGDRVVVNVKNLMQDNGTSVHWHGVRQYYSVGNDGTGGITECPIAPGHTRQYAFQATQYGTSFYHSHFSAQTGDGIFGPIVIEGPVSANYDIDLGPYMISEWYYMTTWQVNSLSIEALQGSVLPPQAQNTLINGTNTNINGSGQLNTVTITPGVKHLLRLVNVGIDNYLRVSLDNHAMQVVASDFVPIVPYYTETLLLASGQRYDVIINANQTPGNYWFHSHVVPSCGSTNHHNASAIWTYEGVEQAIPTSTNFTWPLDCNEPLEIVPYSKQSVPKEGFFEFFTSFNVNQTRQVIIPGGSAVVAWALNTTSIEVDWGNPTLQYVMDSNTSYPVDLNIFPTLNAGAWNYFVVQQLSSLAKVPHPMHLHGHDFYILGAGIGQFDIRTANPIMLHLPDVILQVFPALVGSL